MRREGHRKGTLSCQLPLWATEFELMWKLWGKGKRLVLFHSGLGELGYLWPFGVLVSGHFHSPFNNYSGPTWLREGSQVMR